MGCGWIPRENSQSKPWEGGKDAAGILGAVPGSEVLPAGIPEAGIGGISSGAASSSPRDVGNSKSRGAVALFPGFGHKFPPLRPFGSAAAPSPEREFRGGAGNSSLLCFECSESKELLHPAGSEDSLEPWELPGPRGVIPVPEFPRILTEKFRWPSCFCHKRCYKSSWGLEGGKKKNPPQSLKKFQASG